MELSKLASGLQGSAIREMFSRAMGREDTISFTVGEPDFVTPAPIREEACRRWQEGLTHYTPNRGIPELLERIALYHREGLRPDPDRNILVSCGATEALQLALFTLVDPGDEVVVITPTWPNYLGQIAMTGAWAVCVRAREENGFLPDPDEVRRAIGPRTRAILLNSPANPTGAVADREVCERLAALAREYDLYVISDEVYSRLVYDEDYISITSFEGMRERSVYVDSFSKSYAMTGWRLGYAIAPGKIVDSMTKLHENGASCLPAPTQFAAAYALEHGEEWVEAMRKSYRVRRELVFNEINRIPGLSLRMPKGAFYAFVKVKALLDAQGMSSREFCLDLLDETGVVLVPGEGFGPGGEDYIRLTYAASEETLREGIGRLREYALRRQDRL